MPQAGGSRPELYGSAADSLVAKQQGWFLPQQQQQQQQSAGIGAAAGAGAVSSSPFEARRQQEVLQEHGRFVELLQNLYIDR